MCLIYRCDGVLRKRGGVVCAEGRISGGGGREPIEGVDGRMKRCNGDEQCSGEKWYLLCMVVGRTSLRSGTSLYERSLISSPELLTDIKAAVSWFQTLQRQAETAHDCFFFTERHSTTAGPMIDNTVSATGRYNVCVTACRIPATHRSVGRRQ